MWARKLIGSKTSDFIAGDRLEVRVVRYSHKK